MSRINLGTRRNPTLLRLLLCAFLGVAITGAIFFATGGTAKADPPGDYMRPSTSDEVMRERVPCGSPVWSPTLGFDCTKTGRAISDDVVKTVGAAGSSCLAGAYFSGWAGCAASAAGSLATAWTAWWGD